MDNRMRYRAYVKPMEWLRPVKRINYDHKTVEVDLSGGHGDWTEYDFAEVDLMQCTGLLAEKSYRGDTEEERLIWEGDVVSGRFSGEICTGNIVYGDDGSFFVGRDGDFGIGLNNAVDWIEIVGTIYDKEGDACTNAAIGQTISTHRS